MRVLYNILILIGFVILIEACESPEQTLTTIELKMVDSLFLLQKDSIELEMKDICDSIFLENYDPIVDSLKMVRQKEILDIISK